MRKSTGFSIIEILISLMLMSVLLLGMDALQIVSIQQAESNYYFSVAQQQIKIMNERLSLNSDVNAFTSEWNKQNQEVLPAGKGVMTDKIAIFWGNRNEEICKANKLGSEGCLYLQL